MLMLDRRSSQFFNDVKGDGEDEPEAQGKKRERGSPGSRASVMSSFTLRGFWLRYIPSDRCSEETTLSFELE